jgi:hypothetical protein
LFLEPFSLRHWIFSAVPFDPLSRYIVSAHAFSEVQAKFDPFNPFDPFAHIITKSQSLSNPCIPPSAWFFPTFSEYELVRCLECHCSESQDNSPYLSVDPWHFHIGWTILTFPMRQQWETAQVYLRSRWASIFRYL